MPRPATSVATRMSTASLLCNARTALNYAALAAKIYVKSAGMAVRRVFRHATCATSLCAANVALSAMSAAKTRAGHACPILTDVLRAFLLGKTQGKIFLAPSRSRPPTNEPFLVGDRSLAGLFLSRFGLFWG